MHFFTFIFIKFLFIVFFITMIILFTRKRRYCHSNFADPMTLLETRFVNGEISKEEFERMRFELKAARRTK